MWINGVRNVPTGWSSGYEYHGNDKATFSGTVNTDASGNATVSFSGVYSDNDSMSVIGISTQGGFVVSNTALSYNSATFRVDPAGVTTIRYAIKAFV